MSDVGSIALAAVLVLLVTLVLISIDWKRVVARLRALVPRRQPAPVLVREAREGTRITCEDLASGETESQVIRDDYCIIVDGRMQISSLQVYANGTAQVWLKKVAA